VLLISAGVLNFRQRVQQETPPWDGVEWVDTTEGVVAKNIERDSAADRAWLLPGDRLIGISLDGGRPEQIVSARDVQIYLEQAGVRGQLHYLMTRPSYSPEVGAYWADLDNLGTIHKWTPRVIYINIIGLAGTNQPAPSLAAAAASTVIGRTGRHRRLHRDWTKCFCWRRSCHSFKRECL
jgi:hypothetical protein